MKNKQINVPYWRFQLDCLTFWDNSNGRDFQMTLALNSFYLVTKEKISFIKILSAEESGNSSEKLFSQNLLSAWKRVQLSGKWNDLLFGKRMRKVEAQQLSYGSVLMFCLVWYTARMCTFLQSHWVFGISLPWHLVFFSKKENWSICSKGVQRLLTVENIYGMIKEAVTSNTVACIFI